MGPRGQIGRSVLASTFAGSAATVIRYFREKSIRLIYANIMERMLFDAVNRIDTITQISKDDFSGTLANLEHGVHYASSWTSEIVFGFETCRKALGRDFESYAFIDIGCGRGKVQIKWQQMLARRRLRQAVYGMDYYGYLIERAQENYRKVFDRDGAFFCADATEFDYDALGPRLIVYLYNPFDDVIMSRVLERLASRAVIVVYNNPVHEEVLRNAGFAMLAEKRGFHPQAETVVMTRNLPRLPKPPSPEAS
jgi:SAM-dependent methyltransferase